MNTYLKENIIQSIQGFRLPTYQEIPDTGLYLDQIVQYINGYIGDLPGMEVGATPDEGDVKAVPTRLCNHGLSGTARHMKCHKRLVG